MYRQCQNEGIDAPSTCADKGAEELDRLRRALCIKRADVQQIHRDVCGHIYQQARSAPGHTHRLTQCHHET